MHQPARGAEIVPRQHLLEGVGGAIAPDFERGTTPARKRPPADRRGEKPSPSPYALSAGSGLVSEFVLIIKFFGPGRSEELGAAHFCPSFCALDRAAATSSDRKFPEFLACLDLTRRISVELLLQILAAASDRLKPIRQRPADVAHLHVFLSDGNMTSSGFGARRGRLAPPAQTPHQGLPAHEHQRPNAGQSPERR